MSILYVTLKICRLFISTESCFRHKVLGHICRHIQQFSGTTFLVILILPWVITCRAVDCDISGLCSRDHTTENVWGLSICHVTASGIWLFFYVFPFYFTGKFTETEFDYVYFITWTIKNAPFTDCG